MTGGVPAALEAVRARIASAGGDPAAVTVLAVTKGFGPEAVEAALAAGLADIGENYAQELLAKAAALEHASLAPRWHFIGRLQSNKVKALSGAIALWQSVDRASVVREIARRDPGAAVLVQVDISAEATKSGVEPGAAPALVETALDAGLRVRGLMGMAAPGGPGVTAPQFAMLRRLVDRLALEECSMGMSDDLEVAVAEGSTMVRVGTALFGPRPGAAGSALGKDGGASLE